MDSKDFLFKLLETPSPTGFEQPVQRLVRERMKRYADSIETDLHGNVIIGLNTKASTRIMLAGHCDEIGLLVRHISSDGFIYVSALGGIDVGVLHASTVVIHSEKGQVPGVIGRKPIHHQTGDERDKTKNDIEKIWIDIGAKNKKEAEKTSFYAEFNNSGNGSEVKNRVKWSHQLTAKQAKMYSKENVLTDANHLFWFQKSDL